MRRRAVSRIRPALCSALLLASTFASRPAIADSEVVLDGNVPEDALDHFFLPFDVPAGTAEIEVRHVGLTDGNVLDFGLDDPNGFRGWGGGNVEPAVVGVEAASRSYLAGPLPSGTWRVVVGKANVAKSPAAFAVTVILRDSPTLGPQLRTAYAPAPALSTEARFYAGDFHTHSRDSGDARPSLDELAAFARSRGLDFAEVSDHNTVSQLGSFVEAQARSPALLLLPGIEFTTYDGHANAIGATRWFDHKIGQPGVTIQGAVDAIRASGALFSINHPALDLGDLCIGCGWHHTVDPTTVDAVEISTGKADALFGDATIAFWESLLDAGSHAAAIGGSDDHRASLEQDTFGSAIGEPTTMVFARELSAAALVAGVRSGRTVVKFAGASSAMIELSSSSPLPEGSSRLEAFTTTIRARVSGGVGRGFRFVRDGVPITDEPFTIADDPFEASLVVDGPLDRETRIRAEVLRGSKRETVTSHVFVRAPANGVGGTAGAGATTGGSAGGGGSPASAPGANANADTEADSCACGVAGRPGHGPGLLAIAGGLALARRGRGNRRSPRRSGT
jgi:hypothetical protein